MQDALQSAGGSLASNLQSALHHIRFWCKGYPEVQLAPSTPKMIKLIHVFLEAMHFFNDSYDRKHLQHHQEE